MRGFEEHQGLVDTFEKAGFFDGPYEEVRAACDCWLNQGDPSELELLLRFNPGLESEARRRAAAVVRAEEENPFRPFLDAEEAQRISGTYKYGLVNYEKDLCGFTTYDFPQGIFVSGASGTGKSYGILWVIDQILCVPPEQRDFNIIFVQRAKREADAFHLKYPWFSVLEWGDLRLNMWEVQDWDTFNDKVQAATHIFVTENFLYTMSSPALRYAVERAYSDFGVYEGSKKFPVFREIRERLQGYNKKYGFDGYEMRNNFDKLKVRFSDFEKEEQILNGRKGMPLDFFLENDLCINVVDVNEYVVRTSLMSLFYDIQRYYSKAPSADGSTRTLLVVDEARWLFDVKRDTTPHISNEIVEKWFTTCRESGFGRIILTQEPQSVSSFVTSNCAIRICFPVYDEGLERAQKVLNLSDEQRDFLGGMGRPGKCVMRHPAIDRPFPVEVPRW